MSTLFDRVLVIDWETAWCSKTYTLSKSTTEEYIRDSKFKAWGLCWKDLGSPDDAVWVARKDLHAFITSIDWARTAVLAHNAQFDVAILEWRHNAHPVFIFDSLSMARALYGVEVGNSLAKLAARFELPPKGKAVYSTDGLLDELPEEIERELADYCKHDVFLCEEIFKRLAQGYPKKELELIDLTLKMFTHPMLELDASMLTKALGEEKEQREGLLARLSVPEADLASNDKFAAVLETLGVPAPRKPKKPTKKTPNPKGTLYAFAKTDALFQQMLNGDNEEVALLCEARLKVKSTQARTRAQRFLDISKRGTLPVPLNYFGTLSMRWSASKGSSLNMQNLKRKSFLRSAIMAPEGYQVVVSDLSQIEPRVLAYMAGYQELLDIFRSGKDAYATFGETMFNMPGMTKDSHPTLRQSAKSALLGCGYYLGWASFAQQLLTGFLGAPPVRYDRVFAKLLGVTAEDAAAFSMGKAGAERLERMEEIPHTCTYEELFVHCVCAKRIIDTYRSTAAPVKDYWEFLQDRIEKSLWGGEVHQYGCLRFEKEAIWLPNGMALRYPGLDFTEDPKKGREWTYQSGPMRKKLHAGVLAENTTSALSRVVMTDGMLRIGKRYPIVLTVHDEVGVLIRDEEVEEGVAWVQAQMVREPPYMPGIPLGAETGAHRRYGLAKG
jgi:DNA polymerase